MNGVWPDFLAIENVNSSVPLEYTNDLVSIAFQSKSSSAFAFYWKSTIFDWHFLFKTEVLAEPLLHCPDAGSTKELGIVSLSCLAVKYCFSFTWCSKTHRVLMNSLMGTSTPWWLTEFLDSFMQGSCFHISHPKICQCCLILL